MRKNGWSESVLDSEAINHYSYLNTFDTAGMAWGEAQALDSDRKCGSVGAHRECKATVPGVFCCIRVLDQLH